MKHHTLQEVLVNAVLLDGRFGAMMVSKFVVNMEGIKILLAREFVANKANLL
jgi:hypothetical protein